MDKWAAIENLKLYLRDASSPLLAEFLQVIGLELYAREHDDAGNYVSKAVACLDRKRVGPLVNSAPPKPPASV